MSRFCVNCGKEVNENFCPNCGTKVPEVNGQPNVQSVEGVQPVQNAQPVQSNNDISKYYDIYKLIAGIVMIFFGVMMVVFSLDPDKTYLYELAGYDITLAFTAPGLLCLGGGVLSILSRKNKNLLIPTAILFFIAAVINMSGISDISILFILCCLFGALDIVLYMKTR